jgi:hypothetical protein
MSLLMDRLTEYAPMSDDGIFQDDAAFQCFLSAARGCGIKCACSCSFLSLKGLPIYASKPLVPARVSASIYPA